MFSVLKRVLTAAFIICLISQQAFSEEKTKPEITNDEPVNNGQDITRPINRLDVRYQFVSVPDGYHQDIYTLRCDGAVKLSNDWSMALRGDIPTVYGDVRSRDNKKKKMQFGLADIVTQAVAIYKFTPRVAIGAGIQLVWPTATNDQSGTGKYQAMPLAGVRVSLPEISNGSFIVPYARYDVSYAGRSRRKDINKLEFAPSFNIMLPLKIFFVLYPSPEILYNFENKTWTVPMNFLIGKLFTDKIVGSIECFIPMVEDKDYKKPYNLKIEARMGFFF
jgi:hypothetical protein